MRKDIQYSRVVRSKAMSKRPKQDGIVFRTNNSYGEGKIVVIINATNPKTKDVTSHLEMEIPVEDLDQVIEALKEIRQVYGQIPRTIQVY